MFALYIFRLRFRQLARVTCTAQSTLMIATVGSKVIIQIRTVLACSGASRQQEAALCERATEHYCSALAGLVCKY
jgi:hypothetical protein